MRLLRINKEDLNVFEFDWDLTWAAFLMNAQGKIYSRYGGRDAKGPDTRNSLAGLRYAMTAALAEHRKNGKAKPERAALKPLYIEELPTAKNHRGCIHCHQVKEILRQEALLAGTWDRTSIFTYPLPENVGITLDRDRGNLIREVRSGSPAERAGVKPGDLLHTLNRNPVYSFADAQFGLHKAPAKGAIPIAFQRDGKTIEAELALAAGWKHTNITWRPSLLDLLPSLTVYGEDLTAQEKKALGLDEKGLAFRQDPMVHAAAKAMGVQPGDIILGIDNQRLEMSMERFLGHVRQNYLIGERVLLNVLRKGKRVDLPATLK